MKTVFVDTAALIALGNKRDDLHQAAKDVRRELVAYGCSFVTINLVLVELCNAFSQPPLRNVAIEMMEGIEHSSRWHIVDVDNMLFRESFSLYRSMSDKSWGLVDCASILVARKLTISRVFTADRHFSQAGFEILLRV